ncbi:MAG: hypothetical protein WAS02_11075 [Propionicimonas sp.]
MDTFWGLTETAWVAISSAATVGMLIVAVVAAVYAKRQWESAREQLAAARLADAEASRPYVIVTLEPSAASQVVLNLAIRNIGRRPATDVTVRLDPPPLRAKEAEQHPLAETRMLNEAIAVIAPGQELTTFFDSLLERRSRTDLPERHDVEIQYSDTSGTRYNERSVLDLAATKGALTIRVKSLHDIGNTLEKIERLLDRATVLGRDGYIEVASVVETFDEHRLRLETEEAENDKQRLLWMERYRPASPETAQLRAVVAARAESAVPPSAGSQTSSTPAPDAPEVESASGPGPLPSQQEATQPDCTD